MVKIVSAVCQKGGVGKSTLLAHLLLCWETGGARVGVIDADYVQQTIAQTWLNLRDKDDLKVAACEPGQIATAIAWINQRYPDLDIILIDTPGQDHKDTPGIVSRSDLVLVPVAPDSIAEIGAMGRTVEVIKRCGKASASLVVLSKTDPERNGFESSDTTKGRRGLSDYGLPIAKQAITNYKAFKDSMRSGETVIEMARKSKSAEKAAHQITALAAEIDTKLKG